MLLASIVAMFFTGQELFIKCVSPDITEHSICVGFIAGISDIDTNDKKLCLPDNINMGNLIDVYIDYMNDNPALNKYPAATLVASALNEKWMCSINKLPRKK